MWKVQELMSHYSLVTCDPAAKLFSTILGQSDNQPTQDGPTTPLLREYPDISWSDSSNQCFMSFVCLFSLSLLYKIRHPLVAKELLINTIITSQITSKARSGQIRLVEMIN